MQKTTYKKSTKITQPFPEILVISYFRELWACRTIPNQNDMITLKLLWMCNNMHQINKIAPHFPEIFAVVLETLGMIRYA